MDSSDILGDDGREAVLAVLKVSILKKKPRAVHQTFSEFMKGRGREIPNDQIPNDKSDKCNIPVAEDRSEDDYEEVDYGSGFIIRNKFRSELIITAYHVAGAPNDNFRKNICSEDDLRSRIFGTFVVKFLACLLLLGFSNI